MSNSITRGSVFQRGQANARRSIVIAAIVGLLAAVLVPATSQTAYAGVGSRLAGIVWADVNKDGVRTADETLKGGVTVELLSGPTGPVVRTTVSAANGSYAFTDVADGDYHVRIVAPGAHRFPEAASGDNTFRRAEVPTVGNPERGIAGPFTVAGASQNTAVHAGLQPIAALEVDRLEIQDSCEGYAVTGAAPWDAEAGPGQDTGPENCIVRVGDTILQNYSVSLTGLPSGVSVPNVVIELRVNPVSNPDDAGDVADSRLQLSGPGSNGLPAGCLPAGTGISPASSVTTNADGSITVICNLGSMASNVSTVQLAYRFADSTPIPGFVEVTARAYAGQDDAGESSTVQGPVVEVTGTAEWEARKALVGASGPHGINGNPFRSARTVDGVLVRGFEQYYWLDIDNLRTTGASDLEWPITFTDRMTEFPNAFLTMCDPRSADNNEVGTSWTVTCPLFEAAGSDGWSFSVAKPSNSPFEDTRILVRVFVPTEDVFRSIDPTWERGDAPPAGTATWQNNIEDTDGWHIVGGQPNNPEGGVAPGFEPGWDGTTATGNNVVSGQLANTTPTWDLAKSVATGAEYVDGAADNDPLTPAMRGFRIEYRFSLDASNASLLTPMVDDIAFKDVMAQYPDAVLLACSSPWDLGTPTCETGSQPADGWDMSVVPSENGIAQLRAMWLARVFIPVPDLPHPCETPANETFSVTNEARGTDGWTAAGWLINDTGLEPGWDPDAGSTATGNNRNAYTFNIRNTTRDCGTLVGDKQYQGITGGLNNWNQFSPGDVVNSHVWTTASNDRIVITNPMVCDVFDVSVWRLSGDPLAPVDGADPNPHLQVQSAGQTLDRNDYVIEYAVGTNGVDTQTGTGNGLDNTVNIDEARACRDDEGPWTTDPETTFGTDWRDEVNMVRARPIDPAHVETGPFTLGLYVPMQARWQYNGGQNAGEDIPAGIQMNNSAGWPEREPSTGNIIWDSVSRQLTSTLPLSGYKGYTNDADSQWIDDATVSSGIRVRSRTELSVDAPSNRFSGFVGAGPQAPGAEDTRGFPIDNPTVCDTFDVSTLRLDGSATTTGSLNLDLSKYVIEYAVGSNTVDTQAGAQVGGLYPVDRTGLMSDVTDCRSHDGPWETDPAAFGADWSDKVNMVRVRPIDDRTEYAGFRLALRFALVVRGSYNGGPNDGEAVLTGVRLSNAGGWSQGPRGDDWGTMAREVRHQGVTLVTAKSSTQATWLPGQDAIWNLSLGINNAQVGAVVESVKLVDIIPAGLIYNPACTQSRLPAGVTVDYNPATREVTFSFGDITATAANYWVRNGATAIQLCTTLESIAQPGDTYVNTVAAESPSSENRPTATASTRATGSGQLGIVKDVDKPFVASGETYTWTLDWANTSTVIAFQPVDIIDVLPWNGDGQPGVGSARDQFESEYDGTVDLTGPLAAPTYVRGDTGDVGGTWYYTTADPSTLNHDPRDAANADPAAAGGLWRTAAEITDFADVTGVRFVSTDWLNTTTRVQAQIPMVSTSDELNNVYVNRAMVFSGTFPNQPLLSTEPYVIMPGFTLGDFVWADLNGNGRFDTGEPGLAGVSIEVLDGDGEIVATATTDADGRWSVTRITAGTYSVRIPAEMFQDGGPLADYVVRTAGSGSGDDPNEQADNNNTATPNPASTGLTSTPIELAYRYADGRLVGGEGPTGDDAAGLAPALIPDGFSTFTVDLALMPGPGVDIEKHTNGQDADEETGPDVAVGGDVRWTYVVTNTGDVPLTDVTVTDDKVAAANIDCDGTGSNVVAGPLVPAASFTCVATGVATAGQYGNLGSVTGLDPALVEVSDEDASHYFGIEPDIDIEKATNGQDADDPTGPNVPVGGEVRWTYTVTNTGNTPLTNVTVIDDMVDASLIDCGNGSNVIPGPLAVDDSFTCVATGEATIGQYANLGTVAGTAPETTDVDGNPVAGSVVDDEDASHYFGIQPQVDIEKATNGQDADDPTGPLVAQGSEVRWTYVVRNTGNVPLTDVTVTDDVEPASSIDCADSGSNVIPGPLAPGDSFTCVATGTAAPGQYANLGTVAASGPGTTGPDGETVDGEAVTDADASHYFGVEQAVDIEKATNGQDADEATGPNVTVGGSVRWTYVVTNTGNVPLVNVIVTDDVEPASSIDCAGTGSNVIAGPLAVGDSFTCVADGTAAAGQYANAGTVVGTGPETTGVTGDTVPGTQVDDEDASHYFGAEASIDIEKATNTHDADEPTGPLVNEDGAVRWTYVVRNTGNTVLTDVTVTDSVEAPGSIQCADGGNVIPELAPGDSAECVATGAGILGQYANLGSATGTGPQTTNVDGDPVAGVVVRDEDWSHYLGVVSSIDIEKSVNGDDADEPTGPRVAVGGDVQWTYVVRNTGTIALTDVTVTDDKVDASEIDCAATGSNAVPGPLAPGDSFTCVANGTAIEGQYVNTGTVVGIGPETTNVDGSVIEGVQVTDEDLAHYFGAAPKVDIEKATNGEDADEPTGPSVLLGGDVEWTYVITNTGNVPLTDLIVVDNVEAAESIDCAQTGSNTVAGPLAPGESFTCVARGLATEGQYANLGTVTAIGPETTGVTGVSAPGSSVTDEDWSHYLGVVDAPVGGEPQANPPAGEEPPSAQEDPLAGTGGVASIIPPALGLLLLGGGLLLILLARSRRKEGAATE